MSLKRQLLASPRIYVLFKRLPINFSIPQDGLEFSTPRIENPIYDFAGGCYDGRQAEDEHTYDPRLPLHGSGASALSTSITRRRLALLLGLSAFSTLLRWRWLLSCDSR